jgi:hypothetical protein
MCRDARIGVIQAASWVEPALRKEWRRLAKPPNRL